jgi:hypothetical protein
VEESVGIFIELLDKISIDELKIGSAELKAELEELEVSSTIKSLFSPLIELAELSLSLQAKNPIERKRSVADVKNFI